MSHPGDNLFKLMFLLFFIFPLRNINEQWRKQQKNSNRVLAFFSTAVRLVLQGSFHFFCLLAEGIAGKRHAAFFVYHSKCSGAF